MNRLITRTILAFVGLSLAATLIPLLGSGGTSPLFAGLERSTSLATYAGFLVVFCVLVIPGLAARDPAGPRVIPWAVLLGDVLVFAAIPLILTAYISGVSARGLLPVGALCAAAAAVPLVGLRFAGRSGARWCWVLGTLLLFALPALDLWERSLGRALPEGLMRWSPLTWIHRIGRLRELPEAWPFVVLAIALWVLALLPRRRGLAPAGAAVLLVAVTALGAGSATETPTPASSARPTEASLQSKVSIDSGLGGVARSGLRTPLVVRLAPDAGDVHLTIGRVTHRVSGESGTREILVVPDSGAPRLEVRQGEARALRPWPFELLPPGQRLVLWMLPDGEAGVPAMPATTESRRFLRMSSRDLPQQVAALEAADVLVIDRAGRDALPESRQLLLRDFAALGGHLVTLEESGAGSRRIDRGFGEESLVEAGALDAALDRPRRAERPVADDGELVRSFARPDWQEMDLSVVMFFAVLYHLAFLAAFLLPLLLDSRKALGVYLASVAFVVLVVSVAGFKVLQGIFLRDNQVYTQGIGLVVLDRDGEGVAAARRFLCFASMSGEQRSLALDTRSAPVVYRPIPGGEVLTRTSGSEEVVLDAVRLDRFEGKVLVRDDLVSAAPWRVESEGEGFRLVPRGEGEDPLGLRAARRGLAILVEGGRWSRRLRWEGRRLLDDGPAPGVDLPGSGRIFYRKLVGHFSPRTDRYLLVQIHGLTRPDDTEEYLWTRDLGAWVVIPLPAS